jgi:hypothetical protein
MKIIYDTLQFKGRWSQKRIMTFTAFWVATAYAFTPLFVKDFDVKEFVFLGFIGAGGWSVYQTKKNSINSNEITP